MSKEYLKASQSKWRKETVQVLEAFEKDPTKMNDLLDPGKDVVRELAGDVQDADAIKEELNENPVVRLFVESNGEIDAKELMSIVNDDSNPTRAKGVMALLDGKLDINDFIALYKLFNKGSGASSLLSLLGGGQSQQSASSSLLTSLLGGSKPQATAQANPLAALLGATQQQQQPQQSQGNQLLSALLGGATQQQSSQQTNANAQAQLLSQLLGATQQTQSQSQAQSVDAGQLAGVLQSLLGSSGQAATTQQGFTLDGGQSNNTSSSSLGSMFDLAGLLLGKK